jgi:malonate decarboxylase alpha subunit
VKIGAIHAYVELYARMFTDLTPNPNVALLCAVQADRDGNPYTGPNTEDTPTIAEAVAFRDGVVLAQANAVVDVDQGSAAHRRCGRPAGDDRAARGV